MSSPAYANIFLNVGQWHFAAIPTEVRTFLGSCVSVCLFEPHSQLGAINHILLPGAGDPHSNTRSGRFGVNAMELILREFARRGIPSGRLLAKVFGGASRAGATGLYDQYRVAERNINFVDQFLATERIQVVARDTGGTHVRVLRFRSDTFEVFVKKTSLAEKQVTHLEDSFNKQMEVAEIHNSYVLF